MELGGTVVVADDRCLRVDSSRLSRRTTATATEHAGAQSRVGDQRWTDTTQMACACFLPRASGQPRTACSHSGPRRWSRPFVLLLLLPLPSSERGGVGGTQGIEEGPSAACTAAGLTRTVLATQGATKNQFLIREQSSPVYDAKPEAESRGRKQSAQRSGARRSASGKQAALAGWAQGPGSGRRRTR